MVIFSFSSFRKTSTFVGRGLFFKKDFNSSSILWILLPFKLKFFSLAILVFTKSICLFSISILYLVILWAIFRDLAKASDPIKYKESTDWFYETYEKEEEGKNKNAWKGEYTKN